MDIIEDFSAKVDEVPVKLDPVELLVERIHVLQEFRLESYQKLFFSQLWNLVETLSNSVKYRLRRFSMHAYYENVVTPLAAEEMLKPDVILKDDDSLVAVINHLLPDLQFN